MKTRDELMAFLTAHGVESATTDHAAVFRVSEAAAVKAAIRGAHTKNLFLTDRTGRLFLVSARDEARIDLKALARRLDAGRFSFGSPERLMAALGVSPGAVTALALVNDPGHAVRFVLDADLANAAAVNFHPLTNTATTTLSRAAFARFLAAVGVTPVVVDFAAPG